MVCLVFLLYPQLDCSYCILLCIIPRWPQESIIYSKKQKLDISNCVVCIQEIFSVGQPCLRHRTVYSLFGSDQFLVASHFDQDVIRSLWAAGQPTCWASQLSTLSLTHTRNIFVVLLWSCGIMNFFFILLSFGHLVIICVLYVVKSQ